MCSLKETLILTLKWVYSLNQQINLIYVIWLSAALTYKKLNNKNKGKIIKKIAELTIYHEDDFKRVKAVVL